MQETYVAGATSSWLEGLERSLAQMKEYQVSYPPLTKTPLHGRTCIWSALDTNNI